MKQTGLILITGILFFNVGMMTEYALRYKEIHATKVELPEEYKAIDSTDCLRGHFDKDSVLQIEFNKTEKLKTE
jgi:hypothetical protein